MTQRCYACGLERDTEDFAADRSKGSGRKSICKACDRAKAKRYYERKVARADIGPLNVQSMGGPSHMAATLGNRAVSRPSPGSLGNGPNDLQARSGR